MEAKQAIDVLNAASRFLQPGAGELRGAMESGIRALKCSIERPWHPEYAKDGRKMWPPEGR